MHSGKRTNCQASRKKKGPEKKEMMGKIDLGRLTEEEIAKQVRNFMFADSSRGL